MNDLIIGIIKGKRPSLVEFVLAFENKLELLSNFKETVQDPEWHEEGNVFIHTQYVLDEVYKLLNNEAKHLSSDHKLSLILAAVLHDIGKPLVTKAKEIDGLVSFINGVFGNM